MVVLLDSFTHLHQNPSSYDREDMPDLIEAAPGKGDDDPFELCASSEMQGHLAQAISRLSEREQLILGFYYREELTMKEVASIVGIALSRVSKIHFTAIAKLKASLGHLRQTLPRYAAPLLADQLMEHVYAIVWDESGQDLIEYALVAGLIGLGAIASMRTLGDSIASAFNSIGSRLTSAV